MLTQLHQQVSICAPREPKQVLCHLMHAQAECNGWRTSPTVQPHSTSATSARTAVRTSTENWQTSVCLTLVGLTPWRWRRPAPTAGPPSSVMRAHTFTRSCMPSGFPTASISSPRPSPTSLITSETASAQGCHHCPPSIAPVLDAAAVPDAGGPRCGGRMARDTKCTIAVTGSRRAVMLGKRAARTLSWSCRFAAGSPMCHHGDSSARGTAWRTALPRSPALVCTVAKRAKLGWAVATSPRCGMWSVRVETIDSRRARTSVGARCRLSRMTHRPSWTAWTAHYGL